MKAYTVTDDYLMEDWQLVFCNTASEARSMAHGTDHLCDYDYISLRAKRLPSADKFIDGDTPYFSDTRIQRKIGWSEEGCSDSCDECLLHQFPDVEESTLEGGFCLECRTKQLERKSEGVV